MLVGYMRVSTHEQTTDLQMDALILAGNSKIDSNWEIARFADSMLGFDGKLHSAALNIQRAFRERNHLLLEGTTPRELLDRLQDIFNNPWNEEQALADNKKSVGG
ncbi:MAG: hypothetical protein OXH47_04615 [Paracoccaceae bacterium]|nr:hypothetical protein [Paracoccaceae bacterium]